MSSFIEVDAPKRSALECIPYAEHHVLLWESKELRVLGNALGRIAASEALAMTATQALKHTFLASLMAACATPAFLIKACDVLDNPWAVAFHRAQKAGALLAQVLLEGLLDEAVRTDYIPGQLLWSFSTLAILEILLVV